MLEAFLGASMALMRLIPLLIFWILSKLAGTERAKVGRAGGRAWRRGWPRGESMAAASML